MGNIFSRGAGTLAVFVCLAPSAAGQVTDNGWARANGLYAEPEVAATIKLTVPLGAAQHDKTASAQPRLSFGVDYARHDQHRGWRMSDHRLALGFTIDGEFLMEGGRTVLTQRELLAAMHADGDDRVEGGGNGAVPWIIGGAVIIGAGVIFFREFEDDVGDTFSCIIDGVAGGPGCEGE